MRRPVEQFADRRIELRLRGRFAGSQQGISLGQRVGLAEQLVLQEVPHRLRDLLLLLNLLFLGFHLLLFVFDLDQPFARQLLSGLGPALLPLGLDPPCLGVELGLLFPFGPLFFRVAGLFGEPPLLLRRMRPKVVPVIPASKASNTRLAAATCALCRRTNFQSR